MRRRRRRRRTLEVWESTKWRLLGFGRKHSVYSSTNCSGNDDDYGDTVRASDDGRKRSREDDRDDCNFCLRRKRAIENYANDCDLDSILWGMNESNGNGKHGRFRKDLVVFDGGDETWGPREFGAYARDVKFVKEHFAECLFTKRQKKRAMESEVVEVDEGFFEAIDLRLDNSRKRRVMNVVGTKRGKKDDDDDKDDDKDDKDKDDKDDDDDDVCAKDDGVVGRRRCFAIRERNCDRILFASDNKKKKKKSNEQIKKIKINVEENDDEGIESLSIEIKPKCGFSLREDGKLRFETKTNKEGLSKYDPRKFFEHCEVWSFADGVDHDALRAQLVSEVEHLIEFPMKHFRCRDSNGTVVWDSTIALEEGKGNNNKLKRFANIVTDTFKGKVSTAEFLELIVSAIQEDGILKRIIRTQKFGRLGLSYDYFGPEEEESMLERLKPANVMKAYDSFLASSSSATEKKLPITKQTLAESIEICKDAVISAVAKDLSLIVTARLIKPSDDYLAKSSSRKNKHRFFTSEEPTNTYAFDFIKELKRGSGERRDSQPKFAVSVNACDVGLKSCSNIPKWCALDSVH